ncbi:MAG TPA: hypothetical protein VGD71_43950 [Kribbella sp.]|jgi:hypothetical protein
MAQDVDGGTELAEKLKQLSKFVLRPHTRLEQEWTAFLAGANDGQFNNPPA